MAHKPSKKKLQFLKRNDVSEELRKSFSPTVDTAPIDSIIEAEKLEVFQEGMVAPEEAPVTAQNFNQVVTDPGTVINASIEQEDASKPLASFDELDNL